MFDSKECFPEKCFFFTFYTIQEMRATQEWVPVKMVVTNEL